MKFKLILPSTFLVAAATTTTASAVRMWHRIVEGWRESVPKKTDVVVIRNSTDDCSCWLLDGQTDERTDGWMNELTDNVYCRKVDMLTYVAYHRRTDRHTTGPAVPTNNPTDGHSVCHTEGLAGSRNDGYKFPLVVAIVSGNVFWTGKLHFLGTGTDSRLVLLFFLNMVLDQKTSQIIQCRYDCVSLSLCLKYQRIKMLTIEINFCETKSQMLASKSISFKKKKNK